VKPGDNLEQLYRVYNYWRLSQHASAGDEPIAFQISFNAWQDANALESIIQDDAFERIMAIAYFLPNAAGGWHAMTRLPDDTTKDESIAKGETVLKETYSSLPESDTHKQIVSAADEKDYLVGGLRVIAQPSVLMVWWKKHTELARFIQPIDGPFGKMQKFFEPGQDL
jgi:hypothetical protein